MFEQRRPRSGWKIAGLIGLTALITTFIIAFAIPKVFNKNKNLNQIPNQRISYEQGQNSQPTTTVDNETLITKASSQILPAVVGISALTLTENEIFDSGGAGKWGVGSGVIVSNNGYIVTNNHVAGGKSKILVTLENGKVVEGKTIWEDRVLDLAIVKIDANNLPIAALGDNNTIKVGDVAIAIGNPLGLQFQRTVTSGIISGLNRTIAVNTEAGQNYMEDLIQTDAIINPGNSGGPLLNSKGEVIGINTVKIQTAEGMGFAIPINIVKPIIKSFIEKGEHLTPHIGIFGYDKNIMNYIDNGIKMDKGVYVATVDTNGPAAVSGIKVGDIITHIDNAEINTMMDLRTYIYNKGVGSTVKINYISNGEVKSSQVKLEVKPNNNGITR